MPHLTSYWPLLWLLVVPVHLWAVRGSLVRLGQGRKVAVLVSRTIILLLIILALAGLQWPVRTDRQCFLFVLDVSKSVPSAERERGLQFVQKFLLANRPDDWAGLMVFAEEALVEFAPSVAPHFSGELLSRLEGNATGPAKALHVAGALFPEDMGRHLILLTDGNFPDGPWEPAVVEAVRDEIEISVLPLQSLFTQDAMLTHLSLPEGVDMGSPFTASVTIESAYDVEAFVTVLQDGKPVFRQKTSLKSGVPKTLPFSGTLQGPGMAIYRATVEAPGDTRPQNDELPGLVFSEGPPKVLFLTDSKEPPPLLRALKTQGIDAEGKPLASFPQVLEELAPYDALFLDNLDATNLSPDRLRLLAPYVHDLGGGLVVLGGRSSFGVGGYAKTPLEKVLPVTMDIKDKPHLPSVGLVLCLDTSGSMGEMQGGWNKLDTAKEAALATLDLLGARDSFGIVAFSDHPAPAVPFGPKPDFQGTAKAIHRLAPFGGTNLYPALEEAVGWLAGSAVKQKHILVLSDGASQPAEFSIIEEKALAADISISTIAVGNDADRTFLQNLATNGKGYFYEAGNLENLTQIFMKDALIAGRSAVVEQPSQPIAASGTPFLKDLPHGFPLLYGYVAATEKPSAAVTLRTSTRDPILASWHHGLGRAVAWTSDSGANWSREWVAWETYAALWGDVTRWVLRKPGAEGFTARIEAAKGRATLTLDALDANGEFQNFLNLSATVVGPGLERTVIPLPQAAQGRYTGSWPEPKEGVYLVTVSEQHEDGAASPVLLSGHAAGYSSEYRVLHTNEKTLKSVVRQGGGLWLDGQAVPEFSRPLKIRYEPAWPLLLALAAWLLPFDIAVRRVSLSRESFAAFLVFFSRKEPERQDLAEQEAFASLLKAKREKREPVALPVMTSEAPTLPRVKQASLTPPQKPGKQGGMREEELFSRLKKAKEKTFM